MAALPILAFWEKQPPLAVAAASKLSGISIDIKADAKGNKDTPTTLTLPDGEQFSGSPLILRFVARSANGEALGLCGRDALSATQIDYWIDYATQNASAGANFEAVCNGINDYLALRSFIVGYSVSSADLALWGQLQGESEGMMYDQPCMYDQMRMSKPPLTKRMPAVTPISSPAHDDLILSLAC